MNHQLGVQGTGLILGRAVSRPGSRLRKGDSQQSILELLLHALRTQYSPQLWILVQHLARKLLKDIDPACLVQPCHYNLQPVHCHTAGWAISSSCHIMARASRLVSPRLLFHLANILFTRYPVEFLKCKSHFAVTLLIALQWFLIALRKEPSSQTWSPSHTSYLGFFQFLMPHSLPPPPQPSLHPTNSFLSFNSLLMGHFCGKSPDLLDIDSKSILCFFFHSIFSSLLFPH